MHKGYIGLALASIVVAGCDSGPAEKPAAEATAEATPAADEPMAGGNSDDALVPGTEYHATTILKCGFDGALDQQCDAGVIRNWGDGPGGALVEVAKPDGTKRAIFFRGTEAYGADGSQADGSAGWDFKVERNNDISVIYYGPERYEVIDALIVGG